MEKQIDKESISKRDIILNESFRLFLKKGYAAVSFSDLVEATGISRGNMFHHFKNKEDIFNHAVDRFVFEFLTNDATDFLELTSSTPLKDFIDNRVENIGRRMKSFFILNPAVFFLVRKFYMLRCLFGVLYVDMRCFGVSWVFSKHKIPHPNQWGSMKSHKK